MDGRVLDDEDNMRMYGGGHPRHIYRPDAESGHGCDDSYDSCDHGLCKSILTSFIISFIFLTHDYLYSG
jgi:hypothetical protein